MNATNAALPEGTALTDPQAPEDFPSQTNGLPETSRALLTRPLDPQLIARRKGSKGHVVPYLEGYQVINQANRIFGYGRWGAELVGPVTYRELERVDKKSGEVRTIGMYAATVRVQVRGCAPRSDVGCAFPADDTNEAHDTAIKAAVTDAMKRAFRQFGEQFGNSLYDRTNPARTETAPAIADLRATALALGRHLGLDDAEARRSIAKKAGRPLADLETADLAPILRAMVDALGRRQNAA